MRFPSFACKEIPQDATIHSENHSKEDGPKKQQTVTLLPLLLTRARPSVGVEGAKGTHANKLGARAWVFVATFSGRDAVVVVCVTLVDVCARTE